MGKRISSIIFIVALVFSLMVACNPNGPTADAGSTNKGSESIVDQTNDESTDVSETEYQLEIPDGAYYDGYVFTMFAVPTYNECFLLEPEVSSEATSAAAFDRNLRVSELLGCSFEVVDARAENIYPELEQVVLAEDVSPYDLVFPHCVLSVGSMASEGLLYDWASIEAVDFSKPWWNQSMTETFAIDGRLFFSSSDICITWQGNFGILFNKEYLNEVKLEKSLYDSVYEGEWTIDYMYTLTKNVARDLNGDSELTADDRFGLLQNDYITFAYLYGSDIRVVTPDESGTPILSLYSDRLVGLVEKVYNMLHSSDTFVSAFNAANLTATPYYSIMSTGRSFFTAYDIGGAYSLLRDVDQNFGLLPMPKYDEFQQDYRAFCGAGIIGIPRNVEDAERTGVIAEALSYYSYEYLRPAFFDKVMQHKALNSDPDAYRVLEMMHDNKVFDLGFNFDTVGGSMILNTVVLDKGGTDVASYYDSIKGQLQKQFDDLFAAVHEEYEE